jgi:hypothetical protein
MRCHACGHQIELGSGERVGFRDDCDGCGGALHVCRNCRHHDAAAYNECRESSAERVLDKERANRCDYFAARSGAGGAADSAGERARSELEKLFRK